MSRWTTAVASAVLLAFSLPAAAQTSGDLPRNIELKPGPQAPEAAPAVDGNSDVKTRQIVTESATPGAVAKDAAAPQAAPATTEATPPPPPGNAEATGPAETTPGGGKPPAAAVAIAPSGPSGPPPGPGGPEPGDFVIAIQAELKRVGCDPGEVDGAWGGHSREALAAFGHFAKIDVGNLEPTPEILGIIKGKTAVVCATEAEIVAPPPPEHHAAPEPHGYDGGGYGRGSGGY